MSNDYKLIFRLVIPYWRKVALAGIISLIISGINASIAWLVKPAIDDILIKKDASALILIPIGIVIIFSAKGIFTFFQEYLMKSAAMKLINDLRDKLYKHIIELPFSYFGKNSSGRLMSTVINDAGALNSLISFTLKDLLVESTTLVALTAVALWRRWDLAIFAIVVLPVAFWGVSRLGKRVKKISWRVQEKISSITDLLNESFTGVKMIKAFNKQNYTSEFFKKKNRDFYRENMRTFRVTQFASLLMEIVSGAGIALVIFYGGNLVINNVMTPGDFFSFLTAIFLIYRPVKKLSNVNMGIQNARAPIERIFKVLSEQKETDGAVELKQFNDYIEFKGVSFTYPHSQRKALDNLNLLIKKNEIIAIVGKSGGGKTTLINMLPRFYIPDEGSIHIDGIDIITLTTESLRNQFGIVSQDIILFNDTVFENIRYGGPDAAENEVIEASKAAYAHEFIMELPEGYQTIIGEKGVRLSGGQRQRLSIARALLKNPQILILDEATSSLDTVSEMLIQKAMENLMENRTTLVIAHRLSTIRNAHRIIVMDEGKIKETGTHQELIEKDGLYRRLYDLQFRHQEAMV